MEERNTVVLGVFNGYGSANPACQDAPDVLRALKFLDDMGETRRNFRWDDPIRIRQTATECRLDAVEDIGRQLSKRAFDLVETGNFPLVIGGDHSCAIGTWSGVKLALGADARLGLIWIDAHMDSHTFDSSPSKQIHGMPLACLLGVGDPRLTGIACAGGKILPQDVCLIGVRSFESAEAGLLQELGVRVYLMAEIRQRGLHAVFAEALALVSCETTGYGISIDLDVLEPAEEPGVGSPVPGGLLIADLADALHLAHGDDNLLALEVVEYNPYLDRRFATARAIHDLCLSLVP